MVWYKVEILVLQKNRETLQQQKLNQLFHEKF